MKSLLVAALLSGNYCGADVPWDVEVDGSALVIERGTRLEECSIKGGKVACPDSHDMTATMDGDSLVLDWEGLTIPVTLEPCEPLSYGFQPQATLPPAPKP